MRLKKLFNRDGKRRMLRSFLVSRHLLDSEAWFGFLIGSFASMIILGLLRESIEREYKAVILFAMLSLAALVISSFLCATVAHVLYSHLEDKFKRILKFSHEMENAFQAVMTTLSDLAEKGTTEKFYQTVDIAFYFFEIPEKKRSMTNWYAEKNGGRS